MKGGGGVIVVSRYFHQIETICGLKPEFYLLSTIRKEGDI
jgi:hypothetical protein